MRPKTYQYRSCLISNNTHYKCTYISIHNTHTLWRLQYSRRNKILVHPKCKIVLVPSNSGFSNIEIFSFDHCKVFALHIHWSFYSYSSFNYRNNIQLSFCLTLQGDINRVSLLFINALIARKSDEFYYHKVEIVKAYGKQQKK